MARVYRREKFLGREYVKLATGNHAGRQFELSICRRHRTTHKPGRSCTPQGNIDKYF